jgi:large subunit ribosomal protein L4
MSTAGLLRGPVRKDRPAPLERSVERRDADGAVLGTVALEPTIFGIEPNLAVLHQVVTAQLAAKRSGTQSTRTRAEVRGGGAKPYRQKGTGHARQGSIRAPHYVGGGVAFAPKPRSYAQRTPKKMVRLALRSALSDRASESKVALLDRFGWEVPKTRDAVSLLDALRLDGTVLVVLSRGDGVAARALRNLTRATTIDAGELNAHDVLAHDWVLFTDETLPTADPTDREADADATADNHGGESAATDEHEGED